MADREPKEAEGGLSAAESEGLGADEIGAADSASITIGNRSRAGKQLKAGETRKPTLWSEAHTVPGRKVPDKGASRANGADDKRKLPLPAPRAKTSEEEPRRRFAHTVRSNRRARASLSIPLGENVASSEFGSLRYDESKEFEIEEMGCGSDEIASEAEVLETRIPIDMDEFEDLDLSESSEAGLGISESPIAAQEDDDLDAASTLRVANSSPEEAAATAQTSNVASTLQVAGSPGFETDVEPDTRQVDLSELEAIVGAADRADTATDADRPAAAVTPAEDAGDTVVSAPAFAALHGAPSEEIEATMLVQPAPSDLGKGRRRGLALPFAISVAACAAVAYFVLFAGGSGTEDEVELAKTAPAAEPAPEPSPAAAAAAAAERERVDAKGADSEPVAAVEETEPADEETAAADFESVDAAEGQVADDGAEVDPASKPSPKRAVSKPSAARRKKPAPPRDRGQAQSLYKEGISSFAKGQLAEAERSFKASLEADSSFALPRRGLGLVYERRGSKAAAVKQFRAYLRAAPKARDAEAIRKRLTQLGTGG